MKREDLERLIRAITVEVIQALPEGTVLVERPGGCGSPSQNGSKQPVSGKLLTEGSVRTFYREGVRELELEPGGLVTPLARDTARDLGVVLVRRCQTPQVSAFENAVNGNGDVLILAGPVAGRLEKLALEAARSAGHEASLVSCSSADSREAEDMALTLLRKVSHGEASRGIILIDNVYAVWRKSKRIPGARVCIGRDPQSALESRRSNDSNCLLLSSQQLGRNMLRQIIEVWLGE